MWDMKLTAAILESAKLSTTEDRQALPIPSYHAVKKDLLHLVHLMAEGGTDINYRKIVGRMVTAESGNAKAAW